MIFRARGRLAALTITSALVLAACGDDDDGGGSGDVTKAEFVERADEVCAALEREGDRLGEDPPQSAQELEAFADRTAALVRGGIERLEAIDLPSDEQEREGAEAYLEALRATEPAVGQLQEGTKAIGEAAESEDRQAAQEALTQVQEAGQAIQRAGDRATRAAEAYGLEECGDSGAPGGEGGDDGATTTAPETGSEG